MLSLSLLLCFQRLDAEPPLVYPDQPVQLRARDRDGKPLVGQLLTLREPGKPPRRLGRSDAAGRFELRPQRVGSHECVMQVAGGPQVIGLFQVVDRPRRWLWALLLTPLGLWLLAWNLLRLRGPSRPAA